MLVVYFAIEWITMNTCCYLFHFRSELFGICFFCTALCQEVFSSTRFKFGFMTVLRMLGFLSFICHDICLLAEYHVLVACNVSHRHGLQSMQRIVQLIGSHNMFVVVRRYMIP